MQRRPTSESALTSHLGYWLRLVSNQVSGAFAAKLAAHAVSVAEWVVMRELFDGDALSPSTLAGRIDMTRGAITKIADKLVDKGLAARAAGTEDRRTQTLVLTARGRRLVPVLAALADRNDEEFFGQLSPSDRRAIDRIMREIARQKNITASPVS